MKTLQNFLKEQFDDGVMLAVLSGQRKKEPDVPSRVRIRPVEIRGERVFQATATVGTKAIHKNYTLEEVLSYVEASQPASDSGTDEGRNCSGKQEGKTDHQDQTS